MYSIQNAAVDGRELGAMITNLLKMVVQPARSGRPDTPGGRVIELGSFAVDTVLESALWQS